MYLLPPEKELHRLEGEDLPYRLRPAYMIRILGRPRSHQTAINMVELMSYNAKLPDCGPFCYGVAPD